MNQRRLAVLLTCFNRRQDTLNSIAAIFNQTDTDNPQVRVYLVDDGSTDGTAEAVKEQFPDVTLLTGDGNLFWCGGMRKAFNAAMQDDFDFYLWLNDDTTLDADVMQRLVGTSDSLAGAGHAPAIVVGATRDAQSGKTTYSGVNKQYWWWPLRYSLVEPQSIPIQCDTMNGNCVLIPKDVVARVGNLDPAFKHYLGDHDYGLRARQQCCTVWITPGHIGTCEQSKAERRKDNKGSLRDNIGQLSHAKGLSTADADLTSFREWRIYSQRHGGWLWPVYWLAPYRRMLRLPSLSRLRST